MSGPDYLNEARRWLRYSYEDLASAEAIHQQQNVVPRHSCWLAQQAAEKAIKAILVLLQIDFFRSHDLAALTEWAVEARYPGDWPEATEVDAAVAIQQARAVYESTCADFTARGFTVN